MPLTQAAIHHLQRKSAGDAVQCQTRDALNNTEDAVVSLFSQLRQSFQRSANRQYGLFDPEMGDNPLPGWLKSLQSETLGFLSFSQHIARHFAEQLKHYADPLDAYLLIAEEELIDEKNLYIFWLEHCDALRIDSELDVDTVSFIDSSKIQYALKLNFNQWQIENWQQYLCLYLSRGNKDLAHSFSRAVGFVSHVDLKEQTEQFLQVVDEYSKQLPDEKSKSFKHQLVDYCIEQDQRGEPINLQNLSQTLDEKDPEAFAGFAKEKLKTERDELYTHRASIKKFVRFYGREKDLSISFSSDMMGENVIYDADNGELILKKIPKSLQQQLSKYLKDL